MSVRYLLCAGIFLSCLAASAHQEGAPPAQLPAQSSNRIQLDVIVNDKSGNAVTGLQQQDFTILDNKQPQKILSFEAAGPESDVEVVMVLDAVNTSFTHVAYAREQIDTFLKQDGGRLARPVSIGIFTDTSGLEIQPTPSRDGNVLATFLDQRETGLRTSKRSQGYYGAADRIQLSLNAVKQLAAFEKQRPGRKLVIWLSPGWALLSGPRMQYTAKDQQSIFSTIVDISTQLRQARITLYAVDPLGTADAAGLRTVYWENFLKPVKSPRQTQYGNLGLQVFATHTGGRVLYGNNDIAAEIKRCTRDANAYYVLTFDATPADGPQYYNAIEVNLSQPQLKAQTLSGFYAQP
jgi:VWFA-related protein